MIRNKTRNKGRVPLGKKGLANIILCDFFWTHFIVFSASVPPGAMGCLRLHRVTNRWQQAAVLSGD